MKRIIFRNPFVTKRDREVAMNMLSIAERNLNIAQKCMLNSDGTLSAAGKDFLNGAYKLQDMAAHRLGFRSKEDAEEWAIRHK